MIAKELGEEGKEGEDNVHDLMKAKFNSKVFVGVNNQEEFIPQSTEGLDTAQYAEYIEKIRRWAAIFLNMDIPDPNKFHGLGGEGI
jgi:viroplasmin and RNaseH domain-containing protein